VFDFYKQRFEQLQQDKEVCCCQNWSLHV
jgi:hypothetical protein